MSDHKDLKSGFTFRDLIRDANKRIESSENELALLFRRILLEHQIGVDTWENLTHKFFTAVYGDDRKTIAQEKINLARSLVKDELTWARFLQALLVLGYDEYEIEIKMKNKDMTHPISHKVVMKNRYKRLQGKGIMDKLNGEGESND